MIQDDCYSAYTEEITKNKKTLSHFLNPSGKLSQKPCIFPQQPAFISPDIETQIAQLSDARVTA